MTSVFSAINETGQNFSPLHDISLFDSWVQTPGFCTNLVLQAKTPTTPPLLFKVHALSLPQGGTEEEFLTCEFMSIFVK